MVECFDAKRAREITNAYRVSKYEKELESIYNKISLAAKNGDLRAASQAAIKDAQSSGVNTNNDDTSVQFSADALRCQSGINEKIYTKAQISEMRAKNLFKKGKAVYSVSQFKPKNGK